MFERIKGLASLIWNTIVLVDPSLSIQYRAKAEFSSESPRLYLLTSAGPRRRRVGRASCMWTVHEGHEKPILLAMIHPSVQRKLSAFVMHDLGECGKSILLVEERGNE